MTERPSEAALRAQWRLAGLALLLCAMGALIGTRYGLWPGLGGTTFVLGTCVAPWGLVGLHRHPRKRDWAWGLGSGALLVAATHLLYPSVVAVFPWVTSDARRLYAAFSALPRWTAGCLLPPVIFCEEMIWRGLVQGALSQRLKPPLAALVAAALYAVAQSPTGSPTLIAVSLGCGMVWGTLRTRTRGLFAPVLSHLLWDSVVLLFWPPL